MAVVLALSHCQWVDGILRIHGVHANRPEEYARMSAIAFDECLLFFEVGLFDCFIVQEFATQVIDSGDGQAQADTSLICVVEIFL